MPKNKDPAILNSHRMLLSRYREQTAQSLVPLVQNNLLRKMPLISTVTTILHVFKAISGRGQCSQLTCNRFAGIRIQDPANLMLSNPSCDVRIPGPCEKDWAADCEGAKEF